MPTFGKTEKGDKWDCPINSNWKATSFEYTDELGYAKSITAYIKAFGDIPFKVRFAIFDEAIFCSQVGEWLRFIMATEEVEVSAPFDGWITCNFTAPPELTSGKKYFLVAWARGGNPDQLITIYYTTSENISSHGGYDTNYNAFGYPRFCEHDYRTFRESRMQSIYCTYDFEAPTSYVCPYCASSFTTFAEVAAHIKANPYEQYKLWMCCREGGQATCNRKYVIEEGLWAHQYEDHGIGSMPDHYTCPFCSQTFPTYAEAWDHAETEHSTIEETPPVPKHTLSIFAVAEGEMIGVDFTINGSGATTPYSEVLDEGIYILEMPMTWEEKGKSYRFDMWQNDADTNLVKTTMLSGGMSLMTKWIMQSGGDGGVQSSVALAMATTPHVWRPVFSRRKRRRKR